MQLIEDFVEANSGFARNNENATASEMHGGAGETFVVYKMECKIYQGEYGAGGGGVYKNSGNSNKAHVGTSGAGAAHGRSGLNGSSWNYGSKIAEQSALGGIVFAMNMNTIKTKYLWVHNGWTGASDDGLRSDLKIQSESGG